MNKTKRAYSLVELLLYIGMISVFSLVIASYWGSMTSMKTRGQAMTTVTSEAGFIMSSLTRILANASGVNTPAAGGSATSVSLAMLDGTRNPTIITYTGGQLQVQEGSNPAVNLVSSRVILNSINFSNISSAGNTASIRIQFQLSNKNTSGRNENNYVTTFYDTVTLRK